MSDNTPTHDASDELAALIKSAAKSDGRITVVVEGETYDLAISPAAKRRDIFKNYDPDAAREALYASAGILKDLDIDVEEWLREIKESRGQAISARPEQ